MAFKGFLDNLVTHEPDIQQPSAGQHDLGGFEIVLRKLDPIAYFLVHSSCRWKFSMANQVGPQLTCLLT